MATGCPGIELPNLVCWPRSRQPLGRGLICDPYRRQVVLYLFEHRRSLHCNVIHLRSGLRAPAGLNPKSKAVGTVFRRVTAASQSARQS
jgi:hypothetical protein